MKCCQPNVQNIVLNIFKFNQVAVKQFTGLRLGVVIGDIQHINLIFLLLTLSIYFPDGIIRLIYGYQQYKNLSVWKFQNQNNCKISPYTAKMWFFLPSLSSASNILWTSNFYFRRLYIKIEKLGNFVTPRLKIYPRCILSSLSYIKFLSNSVVF